MSSEIIRDEKYYMRYAIFLVSVSDRWCYIAQPLRNYRTQVEDTHFKVPTMMLEEESEVFKAMFTLPPSPGEEVEGQIDDKPIHLKGVEKVEFRSLLRLLYPA